MERVKEEICNLSQKIDLISAKVDILINDGIKTSSIIEIASAKTITDISKIILENKLGTCSCICNKQEKSGIYKNLKYYSPPKVEETIGSKELIKGKEKEIFQLINWPTKN